LICPRPPVTRRQAEKRLCCYPRPSDSLSGTTIRSQSCRSQRKHRTCGIRSCGNRRSSAQPSNCTGRIREMITQLKINRRSPGCAGEAPGV
jgi:hypothetical protein